MTSENVSTEVLRTLHRIHRQLTDLRDRLDRGPKQIGAAEAHARHRQEQLQAARDEAQAVRMAADAKQVQLQGGEGKIAELKLKLNTASSNREYQALKDQMAAQEMTNSVLDDEILEAWEKSDHCQQKVADAETNLAKARQKSEKVQNNVQQEEPLIRADLARLEAELADNESPLPASTRELYDRVVRRKGEDALAAIENQFCTGCNQHVPLNVCAEIIIGHPMFCKSCGRLLYMPEEGA